MSTEYADTKIREALTLANGNQTMAQNIIATMAHQDVKLLQALTKNHLSGIVAFHVERVVSGRAPQLKPANMAAEDMKRQVQEASPFGKEILKAVTADRAEIFGFDSGAPTGRRASASQDHINSLRQMAERAKHKF